MRRFLFLMFAMIVALMSWEGQKAEANLVDQGPIPQKSIRLRIIANSDSIQDQWLKREVRDEIVKQMNTWVTSIDGYENAVELVSARLPELEALVEQTIQDRGFAYTAEVDFGQVPFPTKQYGSYIYPAGDYKALRVRIGKAKGQNWWCVLFPPLCFIDMSNGDAVQPARVRQVSAIVDQPADRDRLAETTEEATVEPKETTTEELTEDATEEVIEEATEETLQDRSAFLLWKEERMAPDVDQADETVDNSVEKAVVLSEPSTPTVEVRFFILDRIAAWF